MSGSKRSKLDVTVSILTVVVGIVFVLAGLAKMFAWNEFLRAVYAYHLLGPPYGRAVALFLPTLELLVGTMMIFRVSLWVAASAAAVMCLVFVIAQVSALVRELSPPCGCFGSSNETVGWFSLCRTLVLMAVVIWVMWAAGKREAFSSRPAL